MEGFFKNADTIFPVSDSSLTSNFKVNNATTSSPNKNSVKELIEEQEKAKILFIDEFIGDDSYFYTNCLYITVAAIHLVTPDY